jgi:hypothetical protein
MPLELCMRANPSLGDIFCGSAGRMALLNALVVDASRFTISKRVGCGARSADIPSTISQIAGSIQLA